MLVLCAAPQFSLDAPRSKLPCVSNSLEHSTSSNGLLQLLSLFLCSTSSCTTSATMALWRLVASLATSQLAISYRGR